MNPKREAHTREAHIDAILQAQRTVFRALEDSGATELLKLDLTMVQVKALAVLRRGGAMPVGGLGEQLKMGLPAASLLVDKLVQMRLAERQEDPNDRRRTLVRLTAEGEQQLSRLREGGPEQIRAWLSELSEEDLAALTRGIGALARVAAGTRSVARTR